MKAFKRILSLSLVAVMMFVYYIASPAKTLADEIEEQRAIEAYAETNSFSGSQELPYSPLVGEDAAGRAESIRVFLREDGAREAVVYAEPVNYLMNGAWQPIDNTLTLVTLEDGTQVYRNTASDFIVSFAPLFSSNRLVTVETGGQSLSWRFVGAETDSLPEPTPEPTPEPMITTEPIILPPEADQSIESEPETETAVTPENDQMVDTETSEPSDAQSETDAQPADPAVDSELPGTEEPTLELEIIEPEAETAPTATPAPEAESNPTEPAASEEQLPAEDELTEAAFDLSAFDTLAITDAVAQIVTNTETFSAESAEAVAALTDEERDMQLRFPSSLQSEIAYVDPATGLNVRYVLSGKTLREYITLASAPERAVAYSVEIQAMGVSPVTDEAGATAFVNASGQPVFTLGQAIMYDGINKLLFSYDDQSNVVAVDYNGTYYYYLRDGQGSIVKLIDGNGSTVVSYSYDPWGVCTTTGSMASTLGALNPFRYHGYVYDEETGWYYLLSRYYNPTVGRYLSADTLSSTGQGVLGYNMYAYCLNNPTTNYDPSGSLSFSNIFSGASLLSIGLAAVAIGATILTCGAAAPIMVAVAAATTTTGIVTVANGIAEVQEGLTATNDTSNDGQNFMRDAFFRGDKAAYEKQRDVIATVAEVGTFLCTAYIGIKGGVCFVAGTAVLTAAGQVPIESISEGDLVYASDPETGESGYKRVVQTFVNETDELVHLQYGGTTVTTTPTHPFYQPQKGWIDAIDLRAGDILVKSNGEYVVVEAVEHELLEEPITVYNFEVEGFHTYYVGDTSVLVHNDCTKPRSPRKVGEDLIKRNDFDAHSFKRQNGARGPVAHWDIFQDTADKGRIWLGDKAQKVWIITKHHFSDLFKWF